MQNLKTLLHKKLAGARKVLVLGVGSELRADDAAGMLAAEAIKKSCSSRNIPLKVIFASTAPENFTGEIKRFSPSHIILIDSADLGKKPGEISFSGSKEISGISFSTHQLPLRIMFDYLKNSLDCDVLVIGIQPQTLEFGKPPSKSVLRAVESLAAAFKGALQKGLMKKSFFISAILTGCLFIVTTVYAQNTSRVYNCGLRVVDFDYSYPDGSKEVLTTAIWYPTNASEQLYKYSAAGEDRFVESKVALDAPIAWEHGPYPLIIYVHGLYGCANSSAFLMEYLARHGYIVVASDYTDTLPPGYKEQAAFVRFGGGNGMSVVEGMQAIKQLAGYMNSSRNDFLKYLARYRLEQPSFVIDKLLEMNDNSGSFLYGFIRTDALGICGHSLGGTTALAKAGAYPGGEFRDKRIKAALILSAPAYPFEKSASGVRVPMMFMSGDNDKPTLGPEIPRQALYDKVPPPKFYLVLIKATHFSFTNSVYAGNLLSEARNTVPVASTIVQYALAFFDRYLLNDLSAGKWIKEFGPPLAGFTYHDKGRE